MPVSCSDTLDCVACLQAKSHKLPFPLSKSHSSSPFELIHMDVWGPSPVLSHQGFRYYLLIVDDYTRYTWLYPLHYKSDVKHTVAQFKSYVNTQFHTYVQTVRSDNGGEFVNLFLLELFLNHGVIHQTSCPHTPEQNGVVERKYRHLIETTIALLLQSSLPTNFWLEALTTAVYLANRLPHTTLNFQVPYCLLFNTSPDYSSLKPFGCSCFPWLKPYTSNKLSPKSQHCIFLGYCPNTKGYRCYNPVTSKVYTSRHVRFLESDFPYPSLSSQSVVSMSDSFSRQFNVPLTNFDDITVSVTVPSPVSSSSSTTTSTSSSSAPVNDHLDIPVTDSTVSITPFTLSNSNTVSSSSSTNTSTPSSQVASDIPSTSLVSAHQTLPSSQLSTSHNIHPMVTRSKHGISKPKIHFGMSALNTTESPVTVEPTYFSEAVKHPVWQQAMNEEFDALINQGTWTLVSPPPTANIIGCYMV